MEADCEQINWTTADRIISLCFPFGAVSSEDDNETTSGCYRPVPARCELFLRTKSIAAGIS